MEGPPEHLHVRRTAHLVTARMAADVCSLHTVRRGGRRVRLLVRGRHDYGQCTATYQYGLLSRMYWALVR